MGAIKFIVALGAAVGLVGVFMPVLKVTDQAKEVAKAADAMAAKAGVAMPKLSGGGLFAALEKGSLWSVKDIPGAPGAVVGIVWGILGGLALALIFAVLGIVKSYGRGFAIGSLLFALAPAGLGTMLFLEAGKKGGAGMGAMLLMAGGCLAVLAALIATIKPEPKKA